jgi:hypothetical protein
MQKSASSCNAPGNFKMDNKIAHSTGNTQPFSAGSDSHEAGTNNPTVIQNGVGWIIESWTGHDKLPLEESSTPG